jgi:hypothetical protein
MRKTRKLRCAVLGAVCLAVGSAQAQQSPPSLGSTQPSMAPASMEEPQPGDHWVYQVRDEITGKISSTREQVITEVTPKNISLRIRFVETSNENLYLYDRSWNLLSEANWRYSPYLGSSEIRLPLAANKTWTFQSENVNSSSGSVWKESGTSKVVGQETLTIKAGTFETFKIETGFSSYNIKDPAKKNETTYQTWYAPAVARWVKRVIIQKTDNHLRSSTTFELIEYGRKQ